VIKYLGSKRVLVPRLVSLVRALPSVRTAADLFSGTSRVAHAWKKAGLRVTANDHNTYALTLARCYVQADGARVRAEAERLIAELSLVPPRAGWFTQTYSEDARYFHPQNGARIEAIRERIAALSLEPELEAVLLVSLMEAADRVDSTVGVQMAYLKSWAKRAHNELALRLPEVVDGAGTALGLDAAEAARVVGHVDLAYLDPPYNQHSYRGNYHVWETLVRWDAPETYGVAKKRVDCRTQKSAFNRRKDGEMAFRELVAAIDARFVLVSFNDEGYLAPSAVSAILGGRGVVHEVAVPFHRYVGARIGIYNPGGEKVGAVSHTENHEHLFLVDTEHRLTSIDAQAALEL
jgi:adenine-specific DNA-methyltransferase